MRILQTVMIFISVVLASTVRNRRLRRSTSGVDVQELEITSRVAFRYAEVLVRSVMVNKRSVDQEVAFQVRLPKEAYITSFHIITGNRTLTATIKEKKTAQKEYDEAKKDNVTAGLVTQQAVRDDLDLDIFQIDVNVAANAKVEFQLGYEEFLRRHAGKYSQALYIDSEHVIPSLVVKCTFMEKQKFKLLSFKAPYDDPEVSHDEGSLTPDGYYVKTLEWRPEHTVHKTATVETYEPIQIEYELQMDETGGIFYFNNDGDFVHLFSVPCDERKVMAKQIVFVIDISGSMDGNPILQVRLAMVTILSHLRVNDYFNIIIFDGTSAMWKPRFQQANADNVHAAKTFIQDKVKASGSTNINDALLQAIGLFDNADERSGQIIVFLTDGSPTAGVTNTALIRKNVRARNFIGGEQCCRSTINTIAFGRHADISFLQMIAYENAGTFTIIKEIQSSIADSELVEMYEDIKNPYYKNLIFSFEVDNAVLPETSVTQTEFLQYDCGSEIVVSGWARAGETVHPTVKVVGAQEDDVFNSVPTVLILNDDSEVISRLVAYQWVKELLRKAETTTDAELRKAAKKRALELSLEYGFVTPLTSLVVTDYPKENTGSLDYELYGKSSHSSNCPKFSCNRLVCLNIVLLAPFLFWWSTK